MITTTFECTCHGELKLTHHPGANTYTCVSCGASTKHILEPKQFKE